VRTPRPVELPEPRGNRGRHAPGGTFEVLRCEVGKRDGLPGEKSAQVDDLGTKDGEREPTTQVVQPLGRIVGVGAAELRRQSTDTLATARTLLRLGVVVGPLYRGAGLAQALLRDGFDLARPPLSVLAPDRRSCGRPR